MLNEDLHHMRHALRLGERGLGRTWPNPSVGALVIKDNAIIGEGVTAKGGRPHAETQALAQAGGSAKDATLYVTLEPCSHHGKTLACSEAIIAAGITRVVSACGDPNPLVSGKGYAALREAGIEVVEGVCEVDARVAHEGFFSLITRKRPFVTLKIASSLDGKIADANGKSHWITGSQARNRVHALRARHDAILTGIGTVLYDDPQLNCRLSGLEENSPQRVVMDSNLRIPEAARILPAWIYTSQSTLDKEKTKVSALCKAGSFVYAAPTDAALLSLTHILHHLGERGVTRLMVEAGCSLASEMMRRKLVDRIYWFRAPLIIGDKGLPALLGDEGLTLSGIQRFSCVSYERIGGDLLEVYDCAAYNNISG